MKKIITAIAVLLLALVGGGSGYIASQNLGSYSGINILQRPIHYATSTGSYAANVPVKVLDYDYSRKYARIQNLSDVIS